MRRFLDWTQTNPAGGGNGSSDNGQHQQVSTRKTTSLQTHPPSTSSASSGANSKLTNLSNPANELELQQLARLLHDIKYYQASSSPLPCPAGSQSQQEFVDKLHRALPLFINAFGANIVHSLSTSHYNHQQQQQFTTSLTYIDKSASQISLLDDWSQGGLGGGGSGHSSNPSSPLPPSSPPIDKLPDILPFSFTVARLFVSEVRQRASDKHAEDASLAILQFLNGSKQHAFPDKQNQDDGQHQQVITSVRDSSQGWNLLLVLNTLANSQSPQIIQLLCDASLPSTLIKCLYLFFDLPPKFTPAQERGGQDKHSDRQERGEKSETTCNEINTNEYISTALIKAFTQLLVQLSSYQSGIDELIKKDDLRLLVGVASSQCSAHNRAWRKTAFLTLLAISKNMRDNFMYLEQNISIQVYVENMHRINSLGLTTTEDLVDMIRVLIEFLYNLDVNNRNQPRCIGPLIEQYKSSRLLDLIEEILFNIDDSIAQEAESANVMASTGVDSLDCPASQQPSVSSEAGVSIDDHRRFGKRLVHSFVTLAKIFFSQETMVKNTTLRPLTTSRFEMLDQFKMPRPSSRDCILNNEAIRLFKMTWSKCKDPHIIEAVLDSTIQLFNDDKYNYFVFESQQLLVYYMTSTNFLQLPCKLRNKLFKFLEFIIIETHYIPCLELGTLGTIIKSKGTSEIDQAMILRTLIACLKFSSKFGDIFREIGLLEVVIELLIENMQDDKLGQFPDRLDVLYLLLETSQFLLAGPNNINCTQFNESGAARNVFTCLSKPKFFHLFVPVHSSSSDDGGPINNWSRTSTPTPTSIYKSRHAVAMAHAPYLWADQGTNKAPPRPSIKQIQKVAFTIIRQLILSSAGDEHLANLLGLLGRNIDDLKTIAKQDVTFVDEQNHEQQTKQQHLDLTFLISQEINLKIYILKSLMIILKDSHRCRTLFRKVGGFIYLISGLNTIEKALPPFELADNRAAECHERWRNITGRRVWRLIKNSLVTIVVALRSERMNLRAFTEDVLGRFVEAIRKLGCFNEKQKALRQPSKLMPKTDNFNSFKSIFLSPPARDFSNIAEDNMKPNEACCQVFRFLYDMSLDMADGTLELERQLTEESAKMFKGHASCDTKSISFDYCSEISIGETGIHKRRSHLQKVPPRLPSLDLSSCHRNTAVLTFPCIILCMMDLIPSCPTEDLMIFVSMIIKSLFEYERNQQLLCEAGMINKLLSPVWRISITEKNHFLHDISEFMLEKLTKQAITPRELRTFLRLNKPLCCSNIDDIQVDVNDSGAEESKQQPVEKIPTSRIETFVSMMSEDESKTQPPFVEFDMAAGGCSSIFMPSIAPINAKSLPPNTSSFLNSTLDVHTNEKNGILGGVGSSERQFPPQTGFTFSSWICVDKFPTRSPDASHNIRLLTIYRASAATGKEYSCFRVQVSALDRALTISTQESLLFDNENRPDIEHDPDCFVRIWTPETLFEGRWHHIAMTIRKGSSRQSTIHVYIDGSPIHNQRICYISNFVGSTNSGSLGLNSSSDSPAAFVNAFIGSLPQVRSQTSTRWKQGPCHLLEEPLEAGFIMAINALGPSYIGNFLGSSCLKDLSKSKWSKSADAPKKANMQADRNQKHLMHQQSAGVTQSARQGIPLTRVSSSGVANSTAMAYRQNRLADQFFGIAEDRILISIDARSTSLISLSRMRRIYTRFDCRQVSRFLGIANNENSTPLLLLHNAALHLNGASRTIGALTVGHDHVRYFVPSPTEQTLFSLGGCYVLIGFVAQAQSPASLQTSLRALVIALKSNPKLRAQMDNINGYQILTVMFWRKKQLLTIDILSLVFLLVATEYKDHTISGLQQRKSSHKVERAIDQVSALRDLVCDNFDLWLQTNLITQVLEFIYNLISSSELEQQVNEGGSSSPRLKNLKCLRDMDLLPRLLRLLPRNPKMDSDVEQKGCVKLSQTFDAKAIYLIKQTVFELLNRTPRQSDILYFGQFLASLLPSCKSERAQQTISLRNVLLRSLLQMMTRNKQKEINQAMQEELVRILGFDWFILFIHGSHLDPETITIGFLNLMIILSNDELYASFKSGNSSNGGWLKEPIFPTIDGKFNVQMLGLNYGMFFGFGGKRKAICREMLEAPNFYLLTSCLRNLKRMPRIYLMIFQTMICRLTNLEPSVLDLIGAFERLNLDVLCDSLIGDTHHKRRQTLSGIQFRSLELTVCLIYMIRDIMCDLEEHEGNQSVGNFPNDIIRFLMYLYNNNLEFQDFCRGSEDLIDALSESLMHDPDHHGETEKEPSSRQITNHPAAKEVLELSRLIILDKMTEFSEAHEMGAAEQLQTFERFLTSLASCRDAQGELVDYILRQILLMIDSTARHNSTKTIGGSDNFKQFQLLLVNSIAVAQVVTDKIWSNELYANNLARISTVIDHMLCLAEQIYKFNEILPKNQPPYAFIMQHVLDRAILFAFSRPINHVSDKMLQLDLLKKAHDNKTILILNHMHSMHSAEFFVCLTYCLMNIIEENVPSPTRRQLAGQPPGPDQQPTLIERQFGQPSPTRTNNDGPSSSALLILSMAKKVWDAVYQSKKGILSEAFDVSLSLPAFTLDTSPDLMQLKPDIIESCEKYWSHLIEIEAKPRRRIQAKQTEPTQGTASAAVNILSGRLTRVVNAASFVSRVVGATAGSMASNVNMVGERLAQNRTNRRDLMNQRSPSDLSSSAGVSNRQLEHQQSSGAILSASGNTTSTSLEVKLDSFKCSNLSQGQMLKTCQTHISIIEDFILNQTLQKDYKFALHKYLCDEWLDIEYEVLLRERALFGPDYGSQLDKWCLNMTEGPRRMRKKMVNNTRQFYQNYAYQSEHYNPSNKSLRYRPPMSYDSHLYHLKTLKIEKCLLDTPSDQTPGNKTAPPTTQETGSAQDESKDAPMASLDEVDSVRQSAGTPTNQERPLINVDSPSSPVKSQGFRTSSLESLSSAHLRRCSSGSPRPSEADQDDGDSTSFVDFSPEIEAETTLARESENTDSLSVLRLLEKNDRISHMFRCSRVQGLDTFEGLLLFGKEHFYLIDGFTLLKTREVRDIDSLPPDAHDPIIPNSTPNIQAHSKKTCSKYSFDSVVEVHKRRYLLQPIALEVFSSDGRNSLIVFPRNIRNKVYSRLMQVATQITNNANESLAGQKSNVSVEGGSGLLSNLMGETSVTQRWVRGELSNFQYLMNLNTIAGRSYNDLMQYPIFPWILADYESDCLDLTKASSFRDLSRPVGAQTSERLEQFKRRFADWDDNETPPYHYGTFYSSAMIVASYMVRMEPFTQHFLRLQGDHFDLADRMFHSISDSWLSASKHNMADIKELIPEFFYLPEFLKNDNKFDLGIKQNGMRLNDVVLPPWAKGDAREFIRLHRSALESDYVSAHLHEWIDLIFGHKQQGQAAIDAVNVFHHLFYEGNVDIYNTDIDPIKKNAVIGFINNFGQVPKQLFKKPHPVRKVTNSSPLQGSALPITPILPSLAANSNAGAAHRSLTHCPHLLHPTNSTIKDLRGPVGQIVLIDKNIVAVEQNKLLIPPEYCRYVAWGHADRSLRLGLYDSDKPIFVWEGGDNLQPSEILCCAIPNSRTMISAGTDSLITVWKIEKMRSIVPVTNLYGHFEPVTCLAASQAYSVIVSGSRDGAAIVWDLNRLTFVRQLGAGPNDEYVHRGPISAIAINDSTGDIATCSSSWLYLWTINGELLAQVDSFGVTMQQSMAANVSMSSNMNQLHILSVCFSQLNEWDLDEVIVTGASDGSVALWSMRYYQCPMTKAQIEQAHREAQVNEQNMDSLSAKLEQQQLSSQTDSVSDQDKVEPQQKPLEDTGEEKQSMMKNDADKNVTSSAPPSEPIEIAGSHRRRTDTMNSEWVKLSTSSTSFTETSNMLKMNAASPLDPSSELFTSSDFLASGDSFIGDQARDLRDTPAGGEQPKSSTPLPTECSSAQTEEENSKLATPTKVSAQPNPYRAAHSSNSNISTTDDDAAGKQEPARAACAHLAANDPSLIKFSKSDNSLIESFVLLDDSPLTPANRANAQHQVRPQSSADSRASPGQQRSARKRLYSNQRGDNRMRTSLKLLPNHYWRRELYLRILLTRRQGKVAPAAVTSLTISKDHRVLYIGDASGHISSWSTV